MANPDVTWETSEQTDIGFDSRFLIVDSDLLLIGIIKQQKIGWYKLLF